MTSAKKKNDKQMTLLEDGASYGSSPTGHSDLKSTPVSKAAGSRRERKTIQDVLLREGLVAARLAMGAASTEQLQEMLQQELSQNSAETRRRYARSILLWFFGDGIDGLAVERLNQSELGATVEGALRAEYRALLDRLSVCPDKDYAKVDQNPVCPLCRFGGMGHVPNQEVQVFVKRAEKAVADLSARIVQGVVRKVLEQSGDNDARTLLDVILASQVERLPDVLVPEVIERIKKLLYDANLELRDVNIREIIGDAPAIEEQDVDTFLEAVRERIKAAFAKARQETGGKKRIRFFLR